MQRVIIPVLLILVAVLAIFFVPGYPSKTYYCTALPSEFVFNSVDQTLLWGNGRYACHYDKLKTPGDLFFVDYSNLARKLVFTNELQFDGTCKDLQPDEPSLYTDSSRFSNPPTFLQLSSGFFWPEYNAFFEDAQGTPYFCSVFAGNDK